MSIHDKHPKRLPFSNPFLLFSCKLHGLIQILNHSALQSRMRKLLLMIAVYLSLRSDSDYEHHLHILPWGVSHQGLYSVYLNNVRLCALTSGFMSVTTSLEAISGRLPSVCFVLTSTLLTTPQRLIHPFSIPATSCSGMQGGMEPIPAVIWQWVGYTQGKFPVHHKQNKQPLTLSHTGLQSF